MHRVYILCSKEIERRVVPSFNEVLEDPDPRVPRNLSFVVCNDSVNKLPSDYEAYLVDVAKTSIGVVKGLRKEKPKAVICALLDREKELELPELLVFDGVFGRGFYRDARNLLWRLNERPDPRFSGDEDSGDYVLEEDK